MKRFFVLLGLCLWIAMSHAGINEGGVLVVHHDPEAVLTNACGSFALPESCGALNPTAPADGSPQLWFVLAAFPDSVPQRLSTIIFGVGNYDDSDVVIGNWGPCELIGSPLEIPSDGWPGPNTGTSVSWAPDCGGGSLVPVYWFVTYAYGTGTIPLGGYYPGQSSAFVSCGSPPDEDVIIDFGAMGFGVAGGNPCPTQGGGEGPSGGEGQGPEGPEGGDGGSGSQDGLPETYSNTLSVRLFPEVVQWDPTQLDPLPISSVVFNVPALRDTLVAVEALTLRKTFPQFLPADTLGVDLNGTIVRLADLSGFFHLEFRDEDDAAAALETVKSAPEVLSAQMIPAGNAPLEGAPTDRYFHYWRYIHEDAQWHLLNEGKRHDEPCCVQAITQYDNQIESIPYWYNAEGDSSIVIAMMDVGVNDDHEDLRVINDQLPHPELFSIYPTDIVDFCGPHGTFLAGLSAALTNNTIGDDDSVGVAGICPDCSILDIAVPGCTQSRCLEAQGGGRECRSVNSGQWPTYVGNLLDEIQNGNIDGNIGRDVVALNMSFGWLDQYGREEAILSLWNAYSMGIVCVSGSGNTSNEQPVHGYPQGFPFVVGAGGYNWLGQFWESATSCYWDTTQMCPGIAGTSVGPGMVTVCAPTSGRTVTTWPWILDVGNYHDYYNSTYILTSGATAQVSGAVGLIQAACKAELGSPLDADDVVGLIEGTALPFSMEPWDPPPPEQGGYYRRCPTCEPEDYGKGRLNIAGALEAALGWRWGCHVLTESQLTRELVREFTVDGEDWEEWIVKAAILVPTLRDAGTQYMPDHVGWVRRLGSNTFPTYGDDELLVSMVENGVHNAYMTRVDQTTGEALVYGYLYSKLVGDESVWMGTAPADVAIHYVFVEHEATGVDLAEDRSPKTIRVAPIGSPTRFPTEIRYRLPEESVVDVSVVDVTGRVVTRLFRGNRERGPHSIWWDGRNDQGHKVSSGIYWLRMRTPEDQVTRRLVVVE